VFKGSEDVLGATVALVQLVILLGKHSPLEFLTFPFIHSSQTVVLLHVLQLVNLEFEQGT